MASIRDFFNINTIIKDKNDLARQLEGVLAPHGRNELNEPYESEFERLFCNRPELNKLLNQGKMSYAYDADEKVLRSIGDLTARQNAYYSGVSGGLANGATGTGGQMDFCSSDFRQAPPYQVQQIWTTLARTSPIAKRYLNVVSRPLAGKGSYAITIRDKKEIKKDDKKDIQRVEDYIEDNRIDHLVSRAVWQMFMHGGCALYIDTADDPFEPLNYRSLPGTFKGFKLIDRGLLYPIMMNNAWNIGSANFNKPEKWQFALPNNGVSMPVDASRFIFFIPDELPFWARIDQLWWGDSIFVTANKYIDIVERGLKSAGNQIMQASLAFLKAPMIGQAVGVGDRNAKSRLTSANAAFQNTLSGVGNANLLDSSFEIDRLEIGNLEQQGKMAETVINLIAASEGIPVSEFYGSKSGGAHSSDPTLLSWYQEIESKQDSYVRYPLQQIMDVLSWVVLGRDKAVSFEFNDIGKLTPLQKADLELKNAQRDAINRNSGVVDRETVATDLVNKQVYMGTTLSDVEQMINDPVQPASQGMESKDIKDDNSPDSSPSNKITHVSPESLTSKAFKGI